MNLLLLFLLLVSSALAAPLSCSLAWVPVMTGATTNMTLGSYRVNMTFNGTVSVDGTVPAADGAASKLSQLFSVSDSATGSDVTTVFFRLASIYITYSDLAPADANILAQTVFSGNSLLLEPPSYFKENVTYTFFYTRPLLSTATSLLFVGGVSESSFSCNVTMGRVPRMYQMSQITTNNFGTNDYTQLVTPLFVFSEPVQTCGTGARFSSANVKSYDGFAYSCPLWSYADDGRIWWCNTAEPGLEAGGNLWNFNSADFNIFKFKPVQFLAVCTVNGNIRIVADDIFPRSAYSWLDVNNTAIKLSQLARFRNVVIDLNNNTIRAMLPQRSWRGPINDSLTTRYYETGGFRNDYEAQIFPHLDYAALIGAYKTDASFIAGILSYRFIIAGPGYLIPSPSDNDVVSGAAIPAIISQASCWMEYRPELERFALSCRFYTSTWIGRGIRIRLVAPQAPTFDILAVGTLELDTTAQIYDNAYRTIRSNWTVLASGMQTYLSHEGSSLRPFVRVINTTLLDSIPIVLTSVRYGSTYASLIFTFADCNTELLNVSVSRIVSPCTLASSTFRLLSPCAVEIPIVDDTLCRIETISTLYDVVWTTQQVSPYSYSDVTVEKPGDYPDWPMRAVAAYLVDRTRLFVDLSGVVAAGVTVNMSQLTVSFCDISGGVFYPDESVVELTVSGCNDSSASLTIGGTAFTSATQSVYPATLSVKFLSPSATAPDNDCSLADVPIGYVLAISLVPICGLALLYVLARFLAGYKLPFTGSQKRLRRNRR